MVQRTTSSSSSVVGQAGLQQPFCHTFDLTKRLSPPPGGISPTYITPTSDSPSPFAHIIATVSNYLSSNSTTPTRLIMPSLLSPLLYHVHASNPQHLLPFLQSLRSLLRQYPTTLTVLLSWPSTLYPRSSSILTRWTEHLADGVISLHPFPHNYSIDSADSDAKAKDEEKMQGLIHVHKLPILSERGLSVGSGEDMAFSVGRRRFVVRPFYLPPLEGEDSRAGQAEGSGMGAKEKELEF
jgi:elongator complex protein 4